MSTAAKVSYDEYEAMIERGELEGEDETRYELIEGEIEPMVAPNPPHDDALDLLAEWSFAALRRDQARIRVGGGVGLSIVESLPLPDMAWLRPGRYANRRPGPDDILLVVEVSHSSLSKDRNRKARMYAKAGILDYWIVNLRGKSIEVYRGIGPRGYRSKTVHRCGDVIRPLAFPELDFPVSVIFPEAIVARPNGARP